MAKVIRDETSMTHLRGKLVTQTLCGVIVGTNYKIASADLECKECAQIALTAIELSTKAERRDWRKL